MEQQGESSPVLPVTPERRRLRLPGVQLRILVVIAAAVLLAGLVYVLQYLPGRPTAIFREALASTLEQKSARFKVAVSGPWRLELEGASGTDGAYHVQGWFANDKGRLDISALGDSKEAYVRLTNLQQLGLLLGDGAAVYGIKPDSNPFQALEGKWLVVPADVTQTLLKNGGAQAPAVSALNEADQDKLAGLYKQHEFLRVHKVLADETVDGADSRHYQIVADTGQLKSFLDAVKQDVPNLKLTDEQISSITGMQSLDKPFDVWISKSDKRIKQVGFGMGETTQARLTFVSFGEPVTVDKPKDAQPLLDALSGALVPTLAQ